MGLFLLLLAVLPQGNILVTLAVSLFLCLPLALMHFFLISIQLDVVSISPRLISILFLLLFHTLSFLSENIQDCSQKVQAKMKQANL
jgi:hypothetical protein